jgi:hypothetical protein
MSSADLVIVTLFLLTVVYIVNRAIASVDKQTKVEFVKKLETKGPRSRAPDPQTIDPTSSEFKPREEPFDKQLDRMKFGDRSLKEILDVSFRFEKRYKYSLSDHDKDDQPRFLSISVENKTKDTDIYIIWDSCSISDYDNASRRVIRLSGRPPILADAQPPKFQAPSLVAPGSKFTATLTAEESLKPDNEKKSMEPKVPILDFKAIKDKSKDKKKVPKPVREELQRRLTAFDERRRTFEFFLRLSLKLVELNGPESRERPYYLWCKFTVTNMPWFDQLPWNPKK